MGSMCWLARNIDRSSYNELSEYCRSLNSSNGMLPFSQESYSITEHVLVVLEAYLHHFFPLSTKHPRPPNNQYSPRI